MIAISPAIVPEMTLDLLYLRNAEMNVPFRPSLGGIIDEIRGKFHRNMFRREGA